MELGAAIFYFKLRTAIVDMLDGPVSRVLWRNWRLINCDAAFVPPTAFHPPKEKLFKLMFQKHNLTMCNVHSLI